MTYMVLECHTSYAVVLDELGNFIKVANLRYEVGQTVDCVVKMQEPASETSDAAKLKSLTFKKFMPFIAAVAACFIFLFTYMFNYATFASVYISINPEVKIDINRKDMVVGLSGVNQDGTDLIEGYSFKKKNLDTVTDELIDLAIAKNYLSNGGKITIELNSSDTQWVISRETSLTEHIDRYLTDKISVTIQLNHQGSSSVENNAIIPVDPDDGDSNYADTDYGENSDGVTDYNGNNTDYGAGNDGITDYTDGTTDYGDDDYIQNGSQSSNTEISDDDGQSNYSENDDGQSDYTENSSPYSNDSDDDASDYE